MSIAAVIALNRFGLGARPGDIAQVTADPRGWLTDQIRRSVPLPEVMRELPDSNSARALYRTTRMERKNAKQNNISLESDGIRKLAVSEVGARLEAAITTELPLYERLVIFWANHFTVSARKVRSAPMVGSYEREAIRPHVFGTFRDLVRAAALHPAMLLYLDNQASIGPNSAAVLRAAQSGEGGLDMGKAGAMTCLNENLAREIMELHTLGVNGGYTQPDVTNFAKVLTDWSVRPPEANAAATFFPERHEPGDRVILGKLFVDAGRDQALAVLDYLATHPATARHVATKLARHFISDHPPEAAVAALVAAFLKTGGDLAQVTRTLIGLNEPWQAAFAKFKRPDEYLISIGRAMGDTGIAEQHAIPSLIAMGMRPFSAASPQGWPDTEAEWAGADAVWKRIEWASIYANRRGRSVDARQLMAQVLGPAVSGKTRSVIEAADSPAQGLTLLFTSPEFLRR